VHVTETDAPPDPWRHSLPFSVRQYEVDPFGHVNNAVYLNWAEHVAADHVERLGFGRGWTLAHGAGWIVREHRIRYHRPVLLGEDVTVTTLPQSLSGVRGRRRTDVHRDSDGTLTTEVDTEWVWVRLEDGRPARVPAQLLELFARR
jgi:acyl-CoA thioester hydrolase